MLYRILIVDDEEIIRKGLSETIDWNSMGFVVSGTADSGVKALEMINQIKPHVVLVDIRMPGVSGIELARKISEDSSDIYVVILTGFGEFDYAKEAIDYNVFSYLLKPYNSDKLKSVFKKLKKEIDRKVETDNLFSIANYALLNKEFKNCIAEDIPVENTMLLAGWLKPFDRLKIYVFVETDKQVVDFVINSLDGRSVYFQRKENGLWILTDIVARDLEESIHDVIGKEKESAVYYGLYIGLSEDTSGLSNIIKAMKEVKSDILYNESGLYHFKKIERNIALKSDSFMFKQRDIKEIASEVSLGNLENLVKIENMLLSRARKKVVYSKTVIKPVIMNNMRELFRNIREMSFISKEYDSRIHQLGNVIDDCSSIRCIYVLFFTLLKELSRISEMKTVNTTNSIVNNTLKIIKLQYMEDLTLDMIAGELKVSPPHLSRVFKKEAGVNFKDYLKNYRIYLAKYKLRNTTLKIYEIAESVGYKDQAYFSDIFKKVVGCSPHKYKNMNLELE